MSASDRAGGQFALGPAAAATDLPLLSDASPERQRLATQQQRGVTGQSFKCCWTNPAANWLTLNKTAAGRTVAPVPFCFGCS